MNCLNANDCILNWIYIIQLTLQISIIVPEIQYIWGYVSQCSCYNTTFTLLIPISSFWPIKHILSIPIFVALGYSEVLSRGLFIPKFTSLLVLSLPFPALYEAN